MPNPLTPATDCLSTIFWNIRMARKACVRRSWMRRARLALLERHDLTPQERHEIMCVWSRSDVGHIASPALAKLQGRAVQRDYANWDARRFYRARFTPDGQKPRRWRFGQLVAANDDAYLMWA